MLVAQKSDTTSGYKVGWSLVNLSEGDRFDHYVGFREAQKRLVDPVSGALDNPPFKIKAVILPFLERCERYFKTSL
jgi:hypothetical protein